ncbi:MAG: alpha/beta hydrolase-fold protein [Cytophagales bacterium]|nr:alpha/beta hydrolase-fold protein [Cytophagales bacterium]
MKKLIAASVVLFFIGNQLNAQDKKSYSIPGSETYVIHSKINQREYNLAVLVPNNYDKTKKYPVYYLLDGYYAFPIIAYANKILGPWRVGNEIEEVIVVSITGKENSFNEWLYQRWPEYTFNSSVKYDTTFTKSWQSPEPLISGKGDAFLQVIRKEIIPLIEKNYSTNQERGISGHSLSGQFVANLVFKANDIFSKFGINSPFLLLYNDNEIRRTELEYSKTHSSLNAKIFLSYGGLEKPEEIKDLYEFEAILKKYQWIETKLVIFEDETHTSVIPSMLTRCLKYLYKLEKK